MRIGPLKAGILPTRFQALLLLGVVIMNVTFAAYGMEWHGVPQDNPIPKETPLRHLRNRSGTLAVSNMLPLILFAGRNSPLIKFCNIPFDTFNLIHRWFGRTVVGLVITHVVCELISMKDGGEKMLKTGLQMLFMLLKEEKFILWGFVVSISPASFKTKTILRI